MPPRTLQIMSQVHDGDVPLVARQQVRKPRCTDFLCCIVFVVAILAMVALGAAGVYYGDQAALVRFSNGRDFKGRVCGVDHEVRDFGLTFFTLESGSKPVQPGNWTFADRSRLRAVCTSKCPQAAVGEPGAAVGKREADLCPGDMSPDWCTWYGVNTTRLANYCIDLDIFSLDLPWQTWLQDVRSAAVTLALVPLLAILLGFFFLKFVDKCGAPCIWISLAIAVLLPGVVGVLVFLHADDNGSTESGGVDPDLGLGSIKPKSRKEISYGLMALSGLALLMVCCFSGTVKGIVNVLKTTSKFLEHVPSQMVQPVPVGFAQLFVLLLWLAVFVQVASINLEEDDENTCIAMGDLFCLKWTGYTQCLGLLFLIIMLYWLVNFLHGLSYYGTAYAMGAWYFAPLDPNTGRKQPAEGGTGICDCHLTLHSFCHGLLRQPGSLAMGSFVISLAQVARLLLFWAKKKEEESLPQNPAMRCLWRVSDCLADCVARFIEFVSVHAYAEMALNGEGFCNSAKRGFSMVVMKPALFGLVRRVAWAVGLLGCAFVAAGTACLEALLLTLWPQSGLSSATVPVIAAAVGGLVIGQVMMHPFSAAAVASLHCLCLDEEHTQAQGLSGPAHTPQPMQLLVEQHGGENQRSSSKCCPCFF